MNTEHAEIKEALSIENIHFYNKYGYLTASNAFNEETITKLKAEATAIVGGKRGKIDGAVDLEENLSEEAILRKYAAIHFPHKISPLMKEAASDSKVANYLSALVSLNVKCLQTMLFIKGPGKKGQAWHQDEFFIPTRDRSLTGVWIALEDADLENGCLWVIPGSHKDGIIKKRIENTNEEFADTTTLDIGSYNEKDFVKVEVKLGSIIIFNGYLLHMSLRNNSSNRFRRALVSHYCSAESMLPWDQDGRQEPTQDFRDIFIVAGKDPYEYKGTQNLSKPFVRPDVINFNTDEFRKNLKTKK
ncbi:phytanoyl-CoA dioxygenase family protein [Flavivirga rizhaonensis]|uniref:Phytanoyl-CoA dioxygenase family protein n=1 Tax=Flavivirga rizhaonensis TaxID=2559571 RepID=A0A4S1DQV7_9FLAO|nr:phytanoyl-CoA dioxygenase family protein [Flavivirga rizhaonensis]TGV00239.1 phytanoyl-CoA dioxygenase family protein [Flavivirga rizhaonensis]